MQTCENEAIVNLSVMNCNPISKNHYSHTILSSLNIEDQLFCRMCMSKKLHKIRILNLSHNYLSSAAMLHFQRTDWTKLIALNLWANNVGANGCKLIARAPFQALQELNLRDNAIGSTGVAHITKAEWKELRFLVLHGNHIGLGAIHTLSKANWTKLQEIGLNDNVVTSAELIGINLFELPKLAQLFLYWNRLSKEECALPKKGLFKMKVKLIFIREQS